MKVVCNFYKYITGNFSINSDSKHKKLYLSTNQLKIIIVYIIFKNFDILLQKKSNYIYYFFIMKKLNSLIIFRKILLKIFI